MRLLKRNLLLKQINNMLVDLPSPSNIQYVWNIGSILGLILVIQIITGLGLTFHYICSIEIAFDTVENINREINKGWLLRYSHANGANLFFLFVYIHIAKGIYYGSYKFPRIFLWIVGIFILLLLMGIGFLGYTLPFHSMGFWGATVISSMASSVPIIGKELTNWIWGGFSVAQPTLTRFYSFHFLFPFILVVLVIIHLLLLHNTGSNNPIGNNINLDWIPFHPYFIIKDLLGYLLFFIFYSFFIFFWPNLLAETDSFEKSNPLVTPNQIVPEMYFLFAYSILRAIPHKLGGVIAMVASILVLIVLPILNLNSSKSFLFLPFQKWIFFSFLGNWLTLTWLGAKIAEWPFVSLGQAITITYFLYFFLDNTIASNKLKTY